MNFVGDMEGTKVMTKVYDLKTAVCGRGLVEITLNLLFPFLRHPFGPQI